MKVQTELSLEEYQKFKERAKSMGVSEYELAKDGVLIVTFQPKDEVEKKRFVARLLEFFESGREIP